MDDFDETQLDNYFLTLQETYGDIAMQDIEERENEAYTKTNVENAIKEFSKNVALYGVGSTREEQQDIKIQNAIADSKIQVSGDAVADMFKHRYREMYHLLNPRTCIYAYARLNVDILRRKSWREFKEQLGLEAEQVIDIIRYIRKYT